MIYHIIDKKFRKNISHYILQCGLATISIFIILIFLNVLTETAIIAALGATTFIVFTMPNVYSSHPRPLIGGYLIGIICGISFNFLSEMNFFTKYFTSEMTLVAVFGALAVGFAIFIMVATDTEHAPAAGIALALVLNTWDYRTISFVIGAIIVLSIIKKVAKPVLLDLI